MKAYIQGFQKMYTCYGGGETGILENEGAMLENWPKMAKNTQQSAFFDQNL